MFSPRCSPCTDESVTCMHSNGLVDTTAVDRQKLHDRMGIIVRSKEG
jgi:hypothetical protein